MPLIDHTYFDGRLAIAGMNELQAGVDNYIETYEPVYLQAAMGPSLYAAFIIGLDPVGGFSARFSDRFSRGVIDDRWKWIRDGRTFTYGGRSYIWVGMRNAQKQSPIANYVFSQYRGDNLTVRTTNGDHVPTGPNMAPVGGVDRRIVQAWNAMVEWNKILRLMVGTLVETSGDLTYPEFNRYELSAAPSVDVYNNVTTLF